jgi:competence protein ComEA
MDRSAAPWRALDDADGQPTESGDEAGTGPVRGATASWLNLRLVVGLSAAAVLAGMAFVLAATGPVGSVEVAGGGDVMSDDPGSSGSTGGRGDVVVDVQGAVMQPGVLRLPAGSRVGDAIAAAGGYGPRVDAARAAELNLAAPVQDGDRIVVPARGDPAPGTGGGTAGDAGGAGGGTGGLVDLNTATAAELDELPGVGPVTAQKIIDARAEKPFATVDELRERKIVGAATFDKLRDLVTVR